jgi:NAD(P)-dependent dehydrogenase (short-subunit alcohol dehydrogenase family)
MSTILITGATSGIGLEAAVSCVRTRAVAAGKERLHETDTLPKFADFSFLY